MNMRMGLSACSRNGDRDEVEDFEFTLRELLGASDCDGNEHSPETCVGALIDRRPGAVIRCKS